jgi:hypothetical protein
VSEDDAEDVVQLLHESLLDAFTTDTGEVDFGRKGGMSLAKQVKECGMCAMSMDYVGDVDCLFMNMSVCMGEYVNSCTWKRFYVHVCYYMWLYSLPPPVTFVLHYIAW